MSFTSATTHIIKGRKFSHPRLLENVAKLEKTRFPQTAIFNRLLSRDSLGARHAISRVLGQFETFWTETAEGESRDLNAATLDRLTHRCHILEASGESYRLKDAKRRKRTNRSSSSAQSSK